ncbi:MAG: hypothetical protein ACK46Q_02315 [Hyphomonas sp.]
MSARKRWLLAVLGAAGVVLLLFLATQYLYLKRLEARDVRADVSIFALSILDGPDV